MAVTRVLVPFAVGVTVGVLVHKYRHQLLELAGSDVEKALRAGLGRVKSKLREQGEKFSDLVAEIREEEEEEEAAARTSPEPGV